MTRRFIPLVSATLSFFCLIGLSIRGIKTAQDVFLGEIGSHNGLLSKQEAAI